MWALTALSFTSGSSTLKMQRTFTAAVAALALTAAVTAVSRGARTGPSPESVPEPAAASDAVWDVLAARPFRVAEPFTHWWRSERPQVSAGHILVLAVDPERFLPRQTLEPVLQIGDQTAERVNAGHIDGALVVLLPSGAGPEGWPLRDLALEPMFLASPALPESVDAAWLAQELGASTAVAFGRERIERALASGGAPLDARDQDEVLRAAARWVQSYAPSERDLAEGLLVPSGR